MFEQSTIFLSAALAGLALGLVPIIWICAARSYDEDIDDSWRDAPPPLLRLARPLLRSLAPLVDDNLESKRRARIAKRLTEGGLGYTLTAAELIMVRWLLTLTAFIGVAWLSSTYQLWTSSYLMLLAGLVPLAFFYVDIWLRDATKTRRLQIEKDFPFFLDVLVLSMRAGLAFPSAFQEATTQLPHGPMRQELARVIREVRTGLSRRDALSRLAERIRLASISNFVAVVAQAEDTGGSLTSALTEQARQRRRERFQRAEKLANQAPVKLLFPLVAFLFPVTFIILGFPLVTEIKDSGLFSLGN
ncbi:MAG: type II secretion system F family protein [Woeseiaceae bacterium]